MPDIKQHICILSDNLSEYYTQEQTFLSKNHFCQGLFPMPFFRLSTVNFSKNFIFFPLLYQQKFNKNYFSLFWLVSETTLLFSLAFPIFVITGNPPCIAFIPIPFVLINSHIPLSLLIVDMDFHEETLDNRHAGVPVFPSFPQDLP